MTAEGRVRGPAGRLRGRANECALLDDLVSAIRRGESRSLVLRGEAGIGKTALLEYLIASAPPLSERISETRPRPGWVTFRPAQPGQYSGGAHRWEPIARERTLGRRPQRACPGCRRGRPQSGDNGSALDRTTEIRRPGRAKSVFTQRLSRRMPRPWWLHASQYDMRSHRKASGLMGVGRSAVGSNEISWSSRFPLDVTGSRSTSPGLVPASRCRIPAPSPPRALGGFGARRR
jgi:AAA ATPase domain